MSLLDRFRLDGKVAIVTGASSGLGVAFADGLAEAGADVAICARPRSRSLRPVIVTCMPRSRSARAIASPMPLDPPVTMATMLASA